MKQEEKILCEYMYQFFKDNFDKIKYDLKDSNLPTQKKKFLNSILEDPQLAVWSLTELANWGMDKEYLKELFIDLPEDIDFSVLKINDKYIKLTLDSSNYDYHIEFTEPKMKTVMYF